MFLDKNTGPGSAEDVEPGGWGETWQPSLKKIIAKKIDSLKYMARDGPYGHQEIRWNG